MQDICLDLYLSGLFHQDSLGSYYLSSEFKHNILQLFHTEFLLFGYDHYWVIFCTPMNDSVEFNRDTQA